MQGQAQYVAVEATAPVRAARTQQDPAAKYPRDYFSITLSDAGGQGERAQSPLCAVVRTVVFIAKGVQIGTFCAARCCSTMRVRTGDEPG